MDNSDKMLTCLILADLHQAPDGIAFTDIVAKHRERFSGGTVRAVLWSLIANERLAISNDNVVRMKASATPVKTDAQLIAEAESYAVANPHYSLTPWAAAYIELARRLKTANARLAIVEGQFAFAARLAASIKPCPPEFAQLVNDHFWDLVMPSEPKKDET